MATLSATEILADTLAAFKVQFPMIAGGGGFGTDFSSDRARKGDTVIAHIRTLPSVQNYDATNGYQASGAEASSLLTDIPVVLDQHKHVPVKLDHIDQLSSRKDLYLGAINDMAFVLGKKVVDDVLGLVKAANFSTAITESIANTTKATLDTATKKLNQRGAAPTGRFGIVNSDFYNALESDAQISSGDYHGQRRAGNAFGNLQNLAGFANVWEYPDLPANAENVAAFFGTRPAIAIVSRLPSDPLEIARAAGVPVPALIQTVTDPDSGLSLLGIQWVQLGTFDIWLTVALLYGFAAGKQGGAADTITDKGGLFVKTA